MCFSRKRPRFFQLKGFGALLAVPVAAGLFALPAASQVANYQVRFEGNWTTASTPGGVVGGAHFTTLIGGVHSSGVTFWEAGGQATSGVESVAEVGSTPTFRSEVQASPHTRSVIEQGVSGGGTGSTTFTISATKTHPLVTLLSMIGPSPDWFVGVSGLSLLDGSGNWRQSFSVDLFPYDAGTEDGTEFSLSNPDTNPQGVITRIAGTGKFSNVRMARLTFTGQSLPVAEPSVSLSVSPNPVNEGQSVTVTARLTETLANSVTIPLTLVSGTAEADDYGALASITISGGQLTGTGTISTVNDNDEDNETFTVSLGTLPTEVARGSPSSVVVTIRDEDACAERSTDCAGDLRALRGCARRQRATACSCLGSGRRPHFLPLGRHAGNLHGSDRRAGYTVDGTGPYRLRRHPGWDLGRPGRDGSGRSVGRSRKPSSGIRIAASFRDRREPRRPRRAAVAGPCWRDGSRWRRFRAWAGGGQRPFRPG